MVLNLVIDPFLFHQGDRGYGRLFPPQHATLWEKMAQRAKVKQERQGAAMDARKMQDVKKASRSKGNARAQVVSD